LKTRDDESIENFDLSSNGHFVCYATATKVRVYKFECAKSSESPKLQRIELSLKPQQSVPHLVRFF
jgi:hypothetical protein